MRKHHALAVAEVQRAITEHDRAIDIAGDVIGGGLGVSPFERWRGLRAAFDIGPGLHLSAVAIHLFCRNVQSLAIGSEGRGGVVAQRRIGRLNRPTHQLHAGGIAAQFNGTQLIGRGEIRGVFSNHIARPAGDRGRAATRG